MKIIAYPQKKSRAISENFEDELELIAREGARRMSTKILEEEVSEFLGRDFIPVYCQHTKGAQKDSKSV